LELLNFLSISLIEASLINTRTVRFRFSKSLASRRQRLSHAKVRSTTSSGNDLEAFGGVRAFDDFHRKPRQYLRQSLAELWPLIAIVEKLLKKRVEAEHGREKQHPAIAILDIGCVNDHMHQQALGIGQDVSLFAAVFLDCVVPFGSMRSLSGILYVRHNQRQGAYYAEQSVESRP
jgi:hypothetical protein